MNHRCRHSLFHRIAAAFLVALFATPSSQAVEADRDRVSVRLAVGSRARIHLSSGDAKANAVGGKVTAVDEGSVTVETSGGTLVRVPKAEIRALQVSLEQRRRTKKGVLIGTAAMAGLGAVVGAASCGESTAFDRSVYYATDCTRSEGALLLGALFATGGAFWGGLLGYRTRADHWIDLPLSEGGLSDASPPPVNGPPVPGPPPPVASSKVQAPEAVVGLSPRLFAGARVRVMHSGQKTEGILVGLSDESLALAGSAGTIQIPRQSVAGIDTWAGERKRALKGALIGLISGVALDFTSEPYCTSGNGLPNGCSRAASATETALGGAVVGAGIGLLVKTTNWIPVSLNGLRASEPTPGPEDLAVRLTPIIGRGRSTGLKVQVGW